MGLADWFSNFCSNIQVQDGGTISTRYKAITRRLNTDFWTTTSDTAHSLYAGSYGRNTAIKGFSDLDMIFQLPYSVYQQYDSYAGNGQSALLQAVKKSIEKTYSTTSIRADGQVILVPFNDGITFEVVPAFINTDDTYTYPDANDGGSAAAQLQDLFTSSPDLRVVIKVVHDIHDFYAFEEIGPEDVGLVIAINFDMDRRRWDLDYYWDLNHYLRRFKERIRSVGVVWWRGSPESIADLLRRVIVHVWGGTRATPDARPQWDVESASDMLWNLEGGPLLGVSELAFRRALYEHRAQPDDVIISGAVPRAIRQGEQFPIDIVFHLRSLAPILQPDTVIASPLATVRLKSGARFRVELVPPKGILDR
jgi:hypothetical protein